MPREQINHPAPPAADGDWETVTMSVHWTRDQLVQVSLAGDVRTFRYAADRPDPDRGATVFTESLSRTELNRMIATLRRARNQVFGEDE